MMVMESAMQSQIEGAQVTYASMMEEIDGLKESNAELLVALEGVLSMPNDDGAESTAARIVRIGRAQRVVKKAKAIEFAKPEPKHFAFGLYRAVNSLVATIGANGSIDSDHATVYAVMNELYALDGGSVAKRIDDLIEKSGMPLFDATELAVREFAA